MDLHAWITQQVDRAERSIEDDCIASDVAEHILRWCSASRKILDRHRLDPSETWAPCCEGCGRSGYNEMSNVDNLNDCPELLDLAHAHGLTDEILAGLERPVAPERKPHTERYANGGTLTPGTVITTSDVPAALRGTHWKP